MGGEHIAVPGSVQARDRGGGAPSRYRQKAAKSCSPTRCADAAAIAASQRARTRRTYRAACGSRRTALCQTVFVVPAQRGNLRRSRRVRVWAAPDLLGQESAQPRVSEQELGFSPAGRACAVGVAESRGGHIDVRTARWLARRYQVRPAARSTTGVRNTSSARPPAPGHGRCRSGWPTGEIGAVIGDIERRRTNRHRSRWGFVHTVLLGVIPESASDRLVSAKPRRSRVASSMTHRPWGLGGLRLDAALRCRAGGNLLAASADAPGWPRRRRSSPHQLVTAIERCPPCGSRLDDAGVSRLAVGDEGSDLGEQGVHHSLSRISSCPHAGCAAGPSCVVISSRRTAQGPRLRLGRLIRPCSNSAVPGWPAAPSGARTTREAGTLVGLGIATIS
jgi:hypothetical protein